MSIFGLIIIAVAIGLLLLDRNSNSGGVRASTPCPMPKGPIPNPFFPEPRCDCCPRCGRIKTSPPRSPRPSAVNSSSPGSPGGRSDE
jgi:hypothetical protein